MGSTSWPKKGSAHLGVQVATHAVGVGVQARRRETPDHGFVGVTHVDDLPRPEGAEEEKKSRGTGRGDEAGTDDQAEERFETRPTYHGIGVRQGRVEILPAKRANGVEKQGIAKRGTWGGYLRGQVGAIGA